MVLATKNIFFGKKKGPPNGGSKCTKMLEIFFVEKPSQCASSVCVEKKNIYIKRKFIERQNWYGVGRKKHI